MKINVVGRREVGVQKWDGCIQLRMIWGLLLYAMGMWKIEVSGGLGQVWSTPNSWEKDQEEGDDTY